MRLEYLHQPVLDVITRSLKGVELLARYDGTHSPKSVLKNNVLNWLALDLGSLTHVRDALMDTEGHMMVFINLSRHIVRHQWATEAFLHACRYAMEEAWIDIVVEVSEDTNLSPDGMIALASRIKHLGMKAAMNDYMGEPCCLKRAKLGCWDIIKVSAINRPLERVCDDIRTLTAMDVPIVAMGVESDKAVSEVEFAGARMIQGWEVGLPMPAWTWQSDNNNLSTQ